MRNLNWLKPYVIKRHVLPVTNLIRSRFDALNEIKSLLPGFKKNDNETPNDVRKKIDCHCKGIIKSRRDKMGLCL